MLRVLAALPFLAPARAAADGAGGTLGAGVVGPYELRPGAVAPDRMADLAGGRVLGRGAGAGTGAPQALDAGALRRLVEEAAAAPTLRSQLEAEGAAAPAGAEALILLGRHRPGDGGGGLYVPVAAQPVHQGWFRSADGRFWELADEEPNPRQFGALWDGWTDDSAAIQACSHFCRLTARPMRLPPGEAYCARTLYLGAVRVRGAGSSSDAGRYTSKTVLKCAGNPAISHAKDAEAWDATGPTTWEDFVVRAAVPHDASGANPVEIWDEKAYPYQIGLWLGRSHNSVQTLAGGETDLGGNGLITVRGVDVDSFSGWAIYAYKLWGTSLLSDLYIMRCGGAGARHSGDDRRAGAVRLDANTVDSHIESSHFFNGGYPDAAMSGRGCGLRIGADKATVEAPPLGRRWTATGNIRLRGCHFEAYACPLDVRATKWLDVGGGCMFNGHSGGVIHLGHGPNPYNQAEVSFGRWRVANVATINVQQGCQVDLGHLIPFSPVEIRYWTGTRLRVEGGGVDSTGLSAPAVVLSPQADPAAQSGGIGGRGAWQFLPFIDTELGAGPAFDNRLPSFGAGPGFAGGWTATGAGTARVSAWQATVASGSMLHLDLGDFAPGTLLTADLWFRQPAAFTLDAVEYGIKTGAGADRFRRRLGAGTSDRADHHRAFNFLVPEDGAARLFFHSGGPAVEIRHPVITPGVRAMLPAWGLRRWPTAEGWTICA